MIERNATRLCSDRFDIHEFPDAIHALIGPSVRKLGFDGFIAKYQFDATPAVRQNILETAHALGDRRAAP